MAEDYRELTRRRIKVSDVREGIDALTGILNLYGLEPVDDLTDTATNVGMFLYSMANSPYLPSRENDLKMLAVEAGVYSLVGLAELLPFINDVTPGYSLASRALDWVYSRR